MARYQNRDLGPNFLEYTGPRDAKGFGPASGDPTKNMLGAMFDELACALDPVAFAQRYLASVLPDLDAWQCEAASTKATGVLMLCGRQTGKSTLSALLACHCATMWPGSLVLLLSPTLRQSAELFRKCMVLVDAMPHCPAIKRRTQTELLLGNRSKIHSLPGSNPESIRGFSAPDLVIEDEAAFVADKTFVATRPFFATNPAGRHVLLTTPFGKRGHFYELWISPDPKWSRITIKSPDCPRILPSFLEGERNTLSDRAYRQEYLCEFLEAAQAVFPEDWLERLVDRGDRATIDPAEMTGHGVPLPVLGPGVWADLE